MLSSRLKKKAREFATLLNDPKSIPFYESCFKKYPEEYLEEKLVQVMNVPEEKIKVSRGALFNKLVSNRPGKWDYYDMEYNRPTLLDDENNTRN